MRVREIIKHDDGGPAFPYPTTTGMREFEKEGMSLWDFFAAHAPRTILLCDENKKPLEGDDILVEQARCDGVYATAMIAERRRIFE